MMRQELSRYETSKPHNPAQDFEALTPNLLARTMETVEGGGIVVMLLSNLDSLRDLYSLTMDVHSRLRTPSHQDVRGEIPRSSVGQTEVVATSLSKSGSHRQSSRFSLRYGLAESCCGLPNIACCCPESRRQLHARDTCVLEC